MKWTYSDGGRADAGYKGHADDCVTRAIAIACELPYRDVYDMLAQRNRELASRSRRKTRGSTSPRNGSFRKAYEPFLAELGWEWHPTMSIGSGTTVHLRDGELPSGRILARVSKHLCAVIDGVIHDTFDPSREGTRAVYGFYQEGVMA